MSHFLRAYGFDADDVCYVLAMFSTMTEGSFYYSVVIHLL